MPKKTDIPALTAELDALVAAGRDADADALLETALDKTRADRDWSGELSILSELLGRYRIGGQKEKGLAAAECAMELVAAHGLEDSVSGATVLLNTATTLCRFDMAARAADIFAGVLRVYSRLLSPEDYRFAGLYNNMALTLAALGDRPRAAHCCQLAMGILETLPDSENEQADTLCSLAELYDGADPLDGRIGECMERAWTLLNSPTLPRDGYHAFTASKCAPCFDRLGYFVYAGELRERAERIYENN